MGHLHERVNARVRSTGAVYDDLLLRDFASRIVQRALNRRDTRLGLPAMEISAVVGNCEFYVAHWYRCIISRGKRFWLWVPSKSAKSTPHRHEGCSFYGSRTDGTRRCTRIAGEVRGYE